MEEIKIGQGTRTIKGHIFMWKYKFKICPITFTNGVKNEFPATFLSSLNT